MSNDDLQSKLHNALKQVLELSSENANLRLENAALKKRLGEGSPPENPYSAPYRSSRKNNLVVAEPQTFYETKSQVSKSEKITLFRKLFRGRNDVYPERWENNKTGKSGYSPAIKNKWDYLAAKKRGDNSIIPEYLPLTDEVIQNHLEGKLVAGVYPLLQDDTCWFLAVDFDEASFEADSISFVTTSKNLGIDCYIERSRSCNGAHVWIFFEEPIPATLARQLGFAILTQTLEKRHQIALKSYDRFFPNQDTLPRGGFGNLIALPLQRAAREKSGSVFVDDDFKAIPDQWEHLSSVKKISRSLVDQIVVAARQNNSIISVPIPAYDDTDSADPWTLPPSRKRSEKPVMGPFPEKVKIVRANLVYIEQKDLSPSLLNRLRLLAAFQNPEFFKNQAMRLPVYDKPRIIDCSENTGQHLALPRGCFEDVVSLLTKYSITGDVEDCRYDGEKISVNFQGELRTDQEKTVQKILIQDTALLSAPTAFGKTVVAASIIAKRGINTLILVHRQQLIDQWKERLHTFLDLPPKSIGQIGAGRRKATGVVDIAMIQTLVKQGTVDDIVANYGQVIVDECHHVSAFSFEQVLRGCKAKHVLGLTATPKRKDGHHPIIFMQCGSLVDASSASSSATKEIDRSVILRETEFVLPNQTNKPVMHDLYQALSTCNQRNQLIAADIQKAAQEGRCPLVLTERVEHIKAIDQLLSKCSYPRIILKGGMGKKQRETALEELASHKSNRILIATGRYIGEGFDDSYLDTLFLALPISWSGTLQQYVGRLHRTHHLKTKVTVYDYVDSQVPTLARMFKKRARGYKALGYEITNEK